MTSRKFQGSPTTTGNRGSVRNTRGDSLETGRPTGPGEKGRETGTRKEGTDNLMLNGEKGRGKGKERRRREKDEQDRRSGGAARSEREDPQGGRWLRWAWSFAAPVAVSATTYLSLHFDSDLMDHLHGMILLSYHLFLDVLDVLDH